jgi:two-component system, OmpR family, phosphate regulon sensor histidine kinase PhoR
MTRDIGLGRPVSIDAVIAALPDAILAVDVNDRVLAINGPAQVLFTGLRINAPLARSLRSPDILDAIERVRTSHTAARASWLERVPVERLFEVHVSPVDDADAGTVILVHFRETSEARRFEKMRMDFVANASHEMRTPLASLLGFIETLQGPARNDPEARTRFLKIMRDQAQRMARLVDDLLSLSRIEQHLHLRPETPVDVTLVLRHIVDTLGPLAAENEVAVELHFDGPLIVTGDRDELMRVAENLIENAIKYGATDSADRRVVVRTTQENTDGIIVVQDFGPGVPAEHLPRLTERFYRIDAGQSRAKNGTGLGLAIVKHIVARHRGRLAIESTEGEGAIFRVALPLHGMPNR